MVQRSRGMRSKSRHILKKRAREGGLRPITHKLRRYEEGTRVAIVIDPSSLKGMPHIRFQGHTGVVAGQQGEAVKVAIKVGNKAKTIVARPEHLKQMK